MTLHGPSCHNPPTRAILKEIRVEREKGEGEGLAGGHAVVSPRWGIRTKGVGGEGKGAEGGGRGVGGQFFLCSDFKAVKVFFLSLVTVW